MAKLVNTRKDALTETFVYDDGTEDVVDRVAYTVGETAHTEDCKVTVRIVGGTGPKGNKEVKLADALDKVSSGSLTECGDCAQLRATAHYPNSATSTTVMTETKESTTMTSKTATKIELPEGLKMTPSMEALVRAMEEDTPSGTTAELATAAGVLAPSAKTALNALEAAGVVSCVETRSGKTRISTWSLKDNNPRPTKKTAADYKAVMDAKPKPAPKAPPKAKPATAKAGEERVSVGARQVKAVEFLKKEPNKAFSVLQIENGCGYKPRTLAGVLARMAEKKVDGIHRADTDAGRKGFMYVPPRATKG